MNEERELAKVLVSDVEKIELMICTKCDGNGKAYPPQDPNDMRDIDPVVCTFCKGSGKLVKNSRTRIFPYEGYYVRQRTIVHVDYLV